MFAMRSCEYLTVPRADQRRTDILRLRNIRFFMDGREMEHNNRLLEFADCVAITFEFQKKEERNDIVTNVFSGDTTICPARAWAAIVRRIWSYPGATQDTKVSAVWRNDRIEYVKSAEMINALRAAVVAVGEDRLGFKKEDIGTHSIRSGAAMSMMLSECPVYVIMMIGRWSSDAFLTYIRKQVKQFSNNVSRRMLRYEMFHHVANYESRASRLDPRQRNHTDNAQTRRNIVGRAARTRLPAFSLWN